MKKFFFLFFLFISFVDFSFATKAAVEIKYKSRDLNKVKEALNKKKQEREQLQKETQNLNVDVKKTQDKIRNIEDALTHTYKKNQELEQDVAVAKNNQDRLLVQIENKEQLVNQKVQQYFLASALVGTLDPSVVYSRQLLKGYFLNLQNSKELRRETSSKLRSLIDTKQDIRFEVNKQEKILNEVKSLYKNKERLLSKKMTRQEELEKELKELRETEEQLASLIDNLRSQAKEEQEAERKARQQKQMAGVSPIARQSLPWPVKGKVETKFGRQQLPGLGTTYVSNGIVIQVTQSSPVHIVADGKVLYSGEFMSYGSMVVIEHSGDWYTVYGRLNRWVVEKGQVVKKGETAGWTRNRSGGGQEAYFELRFFGKPRDPIPFLAEN
ncbi:MAG: murein hydrolase activator EnvC family protein [Elusimicrobiota bacterium]